MIWLGRAASLVAAATLALTPAVPARAQQADLAPEIRDTLLDLSDILADMADVSRAATDLTGAVLDGLGSDAEVLADFVGTGIAYAPYTGVLRGAEGTLRSGAGNSYDQSLALITLLRRVGYDSQILVGPDPDAGPFSTTRRALPLPDRSAEIAELEEEIDFIIEDMQALDPTLEVDPTPQPDLPVIDPGLPAAAATAALPLMPDTAPTPVAEDAGLYAMVRYRATPASEWTYADPARARMGFALDATDYEILNAEIPDAHLHRVAVTVAVASEAFGSTPVATLDVPAQSLADRPVSFGFAPSGAALGVTDAAAFDPAQDLVFLSDTLPQSLVTLEGLVMPLEEAASMMGGVFRTGAGLLGDAIGSLQAEDATEAALFDTITLEIATTGPGDTQAQTARRTVVDLDKARDVLEDSGLPDTEDGLRSALLAAATGDFVLYSGITARTESEREATVLADLSELVARILNAPADMVTAERAGAHLQSLLHNQMAQFFDGGKASHTSPSVALLRNFRLMPGADLQPAGMPMMMSDIVMDGRVADTQESALMMAVDAAASERMAITRLAAALDHQLDHVGSHEALERALAAGVVPMTGQDFIDQSRASGYRTAAQTDFINDRLAEGMAVAVWPGETVDATVWLEYDPALGRARLASGTGEGNEGAENVLTRGMIAGIVVSAGLAACVGSLAFSGTAKSAGICITCTLATVSATAVAAVTKHVKLATVALAAAVSVCKVL